MEKLGAFKQIARDFSDIADFITIYIVEAHATDGWSISNYINSDIAHHKTLEDRTTASERLRKDFSHPLYLDPIDDQNSRMYVAVPERLFIAYDSSIVYVGSFGPWNYKPQEVADWLQQFRKEQ